MRWRTARVFISSTFRDMHAERDHLVKVVFPALREQLEPHHVHLVDIDLRWGITEEEANNDQVLDLCLQQIAECRPFFVGLLGERYGWVPRTIGEQVIVRHPWLREHAGCSVTELEIIAGAFAPEGGHGRALFFLRDPTFIADVPASKQAEVRAEDGAARDRQARLKERIRTARLAVPPLDPYRLIAAAPGSTGDETPSSSAGPQASRGMMCTPAFLHQMIEGGLVKGGSLRRCAHREGIPGLSVQECRNPEIVLCGACGVGTCCEPYHAFSRFVTVRGGTMFDAEGSKFFYRCPSCCDFLCVYCLGIADDYPVPADQLERHIFRCPQCKGDVAIVRVDRVDMVGAVEALCQLPSRMLRFASE